MPVSLQQSESASRLRRAGRSLLFATLLTALLIGVAAAWSRRAQSPVLHLLSGMAWLVSTGPGLMTEINGLSGRAESSVKLPFESYTPDFQILQDTADILVAHRGSGSFSVVDAVSHDVSPMKLIDGWTSGATLVRGSRGTYAVDSSLGVITYLDGTTFDRIGPPTKIGAPVGGGVLDGDGTLWVVVPGRGTAVPVRDGVAGAPVSVARPRDRISPAAAAGRPLVVNWTTGVVAPVSGGTPRRPFPGAGFAGSRSVTASASGSTLILTGSDPPAVGLLDLTDGTTSTLDLGIDGDIGPPVLDGDRVYVPDRGAGAVLAYDRRTGARTTRVPVSGRRAPLDAFAHDGVVWVNDPAGPDAVAIYRGQPRRIQKYRTSPTRAAPTPAPRTSPPSSPPTSSAEPTTTSSPTVATPTRSSARPPTSRPPTPSPGSGPRPGPGAIPVPARLGLLFGPVFPAPYTPREMAFSPDGKLFVLDGTFYDLSDPATPRRGKTVKATWPSCAGTAMAIAFDPRGDNLAIAGHGNQGCLLSADGQRLRAPLLAPEPVEGYKEVRAAVAYSSQGIVAGDFTFVTGIGEVPIRLWDVTDPREPVIVATLGKGAANPRSLTFSRNGNLLVENSTLWDVSSPSAPKRLASLGLSENIGASFSRDGSLLAAGDRLWSLRNVGKPTVLRMPAIRGDIVAVNPAGTIIVVLDATGDENNIQLWDIRDRSDPKTIGRLKADWKFPDDGIVNVAFSPDGKFLAVMGGRSTVRLWHIRS